MGYMDDMQKLYELKRAGAVTDAEFQKAKDILLRRKGRPVEQLQKRVLEISSDEKSLSILIHFILLSYFFISILGPLIPIIIWQLKKEKFPEIDKHGKNIANWVISAFIYGSAIDILNVEKIGEPLLTALWLGFPIYAGIKAKAGEVWKYPLAIPFFSMD